MIRLYTWGAGQPALRFTLGTDSGVTPIYDAFIYEENTSFHLVGPRTNAAWYRARLDLWETVGADDMAVALRVVDPALAQVQFGLSMSGHLFFNADSNSYLAYVGADNWAFYMGGVKVLDLTSTHVDASAGLEIAGEAVTFGANDTGGAGFRLVKVPNA